jgi:hypothetical protein
MRIDTPEVAYLLDHDLAVGESPVWCAIRASAMSAPQRSNERMRRKQEEKTLSTDTGEVHASVMTAGTPIVMQRSARRCRDDRGCREQH